MNSATEFLFISPYFWLNPANILHLRLETD